MVGSMIQCGTRVVGIDIKEDPRQEEGEWFRFYKCCITDKDRLKEIFEAEQPTSVLHFACTFNRVRDRRKEYEIDIGGSKNVMQVADETPSVKKFIYSSSVSIYGASRDNKTLFLETSPLNPGKYRYALNKKLIENELFSYPKREDLHVVSLRICTVIGPHYDKPRSVVSIMLKLPWFPKSFLEEKVQFMHEEDFIMLMHKVLEDNDIEGIYNFATDSYSLVREVVPPKRIIAFPVMGLKSVMWVLWNLRILNLQPASISYSIYPVLVDPAKLVKRFRYHFMYTSSESFRSVRDLNMIPANAKM